MARKITKPEAPSRKKKSGLLFCSSQYKWLLGGLALIILGYVLMAGGGSKDPSVFNPAIFSFRRIRLAPFLVLSGFAAEIYAILKPCKD